MIKKNIMAICKEIYFIIFSFLILFSCTPKKFETIKENENGYEYEYVIGDPTNTRIYTLKNGLKVYLSNYINAPRVHVLTSIKAGGKNDPSDNTGLAHYLEHMMFKGNAFFGTQNYKKEKPLLDSIEKYFNDYSKIVDENKRNSFYKKIDSISNLASKYAIAGEYDKIMSQLGEKGLNAGTHNDYTVYTVEIPSNELPRFLELEGIRFKQIVNRLFHTELEAVYEEKNRALDNDNRKIYEDLLKNLFPTHPYGTQSVLGTIEHLKNPSITEIKKYFETYYRPNNMSISISGEIDYNETIKLIDKNFGELLPNDNLPVWEKIVEKPIKKIIRSEVYGPTEENLEMGFRFDGIGSNDNLMISLIDMLLNNGKAGLIDINLMQKQDVLSAGSTVLEYKDYSIHNLFGKPKKDQKLEDVENLLLKQIELLKKGEFEDWLIKAVVNDYKTKIIESYGSNRFRTMQMMKSFINEVEWSEFIQKYEKMEVITKNQVMDFVKKNYNENYVVSYKRVGKDKNIVKIEKPKITKVNLNREKKSELHKRIENTPVKKIKPLFLDYNKDINHDSIGQIKILSKINSENDLFELIYLFEFGKDSEPLMPIIGDYLSLVGTDSLSAEELQKEFYKLGCDFSIETSLDRTFVTLTGLDKSMEKAVKLFEEVLKNPVGSQENVKQLISRILKKRINQKKDKRTILQGALLNYARYGKTNPFSDVLSEDRLNQITPDDLNIIVKNLGSYKHRILYFGKRDSKELKKIITSNHPISDNLKSIRKKKEYKLVPTNENKVYWAHFDMVQTEFMLVNRLDLLDIKKSGSIQLFNNYFGSGMGSIVFQEIREAQGLAYAVYSAYIQASKLNRNDAMLAYIGTQSDKQKEAMESMINLMNTLPESTEAFNIAKKAILNKIDSERITKSSVLWNYLQAEQKGIDFDLREDIYDNVKRMTLDDLKYFHEENIKNKKYTTILIGDRNKIDFNDLKKYGLIKELSLNEIFGY